MAIKFVDREPRPPRKPDDASRSEAEGRARFATPIEAPSPVNPDAGAELPFTELPPAERGKKKRRRT